MVQRWVRQIRGGVAWGALAAGLVVGASAADDDGDQSGPSEAAVAAEACTLDLRDWANGSPDSIFHAAEAGDVAAQYTFGELCLFGYGVTQDTKAGLEFLQRAAAAHHALALRQLGAIYEEGRLVPADRARALDYFVRAADQGDAISAYLAGVKYYYGRHTSKNVPLAAKYLKIAAAAGRPAAEMLLGRIYAQGEGVPADPVEALRYE